MEFVILILSAIAVLEVSYLIVKQYAPNVRGVKNTKPIFVDTSALMDGRIVTAATTGFIPAKLVVPRSVVAELQLVADNADPDKRSRARRGLDAINELQEIAHTEVEILQDSDVGRGGVDARLVELAKKYNGAICTLDFNLNKVAQVEGVFVLNINELASNLRMAYLPGEKLSLELIQKGNDAHQAVGYLNDGTMVVVEQAASDIGKTIEVEFIRSLQTAAGRMMFAKKVTTKGSNKKSFRKKKSTNRHTTPEEDLISLVSKQQ